MSNSSTAKLGQLVEILSGFAFDASNFSDEGDLALIRIRDVLRGHSNTFYNGKYDAKFLVQKGDMLIGMDGEFNRARWASAPALLNQRVCKIRASEPELDEDYLFHFLPKALKVIEDATPFVTVKHLSAKQIREIEIPLPPLPEQRRIAAILDQAETLRTQRRAALAQLDSLTQSLFLDMFGDPVTNERGWPRARIDSFVAGFESGKSLVADDEDDASSTFRVLKVSAVTSLEYKPEQSKAVPSDYKPPISHIVRAGDLLFSRANTTELIGATAFVEQTPDNLLLPDKLWRFVWHKPSRTAPLYVRHLFRQPKFRHEIGQRASGTSGSMKNISQDKVLSIEVGHPPLPLQQTFATRVQAIEALKAQHRAALAEADALFASLQQRAFAGTL